MANQKDEFLTELCAGVLPIWARHLTASRSQSEVAVQQMLKAFADLNPHIGLAERQAQQITDALSQTNDGITSLAQACEQELAPLLNDPSTSAHAKLALERVIAMVRRAVDALEKIAKPFSQETHLVAEHVERMYIGFQYQDRVSQMVSLLIKDIARLQDALLMKDAQQTDLAAWLKRLESEYAMAEQHDNHGAKQHSDMPAKNEAPTFF